MFVNQRQLHPGDELRLYCENWQWDQGLNLRFLNRILPRKTTKTYPNKL